MGVQRLLTYAEAGERLGISGKAVSDMARRGELPRIVLSTRKHRIDPSDLEKFIASRRQVSPR